MAFFRTVQLAAPFPAIAGRRRITARAADGAISTEWAALREESRDFLTPWEPTWPADDLTRGAFRRRLRRYAEDMRSDQAYPFFLFRKTGNGALLGGLTLDQYPPRRRAGRQPWLLGRRTLRAPGLHDRGPCARSFPSRSTRCGCTGWRPPAFRPTGLDPAAGEDRLHARGLCPRISLHQRGVAGSPAVCAAQREPGRLTKIFQRLIRRLGPAMVGLL